MGTVNQYDANKKSTLIEDAEALLGCSLQGKDFREIDALIQEKADELFASLENDFKKSESFEKIMEAQQLFNLKYKFYELSQMSSRL